MSGRALEKTVLVNFYMGDTKLGSTIVTQAELAEIKQARWFQHHRIEAETKPQEKQP